MDDTSCTWGYNPLTEYIYHGRSIKMNTQGLWYVEGEEENLYASLDQAMISIEGEILLLKTEIRLIKAERSL